MSKQVVIAAALLLAILGSAAFIVAYATGGDHLYEGVGIAVAAAGLCAAALGWAFWIVPGEIVVDEIETYPSSPAERAVENASRRARRARHHAPAAADRAARCVGRLVRCRTGGAVSFARPATRLDALSHALAARRARSRAKTGAFSTSTISTSTRRSPSFRRARSATRNRRQR